MRRARIAVALAVLAASAAGCADRPNDLDTYYDDTPAAEPPSPEPRASSAAPASEPTGLVEAVRAAEFTDEDVAAEGVRPASSPAAPAGCLARVPLAMVGSAHVEHHWQYPTGSTLHQLVTTYPDRRAADVLRARTQCAGDELDVPGVSDQDGVDAHGAWCARGTCTVLLAAGPVLSGVQVDAADSTRAAAAIRRLAPVAAAKLG
ncbi:hypothetical protein ACFS2C_16505 [Prauserella oleivorans]|uniref:DUF3558 domain-containing protein n=1 Tax=Prauserella oleivorans TaxID=1478153 RepID=A0ABW5WAF8_9PSEU